MKKLSFLFLITLLSFNCSAQQEEENEVAKKFVEMAVSYYYVSIYVDGEFKAVKNRYRANSMPTDAFYFKDRQIVHQSGALNHYYTLISDISVNRESNSMTFYVQQTSTCEEAAVFFYGDSLIIIDFLNGSRLLCSKTPLNLIKWRDKLRTFDKIKNK